MEQVFLPGKIRDRIKDLMKSRNITQGNLAVRIGISESALSRFISGQTDKLGVKISSALLVCSMFLPTFCLVKSIYPTD